MNAKLNSGANGGSQPQQPAKKTRKRLYRIIGGAALVAALSFGAVSLGYTPATYAQTTTPASPSTTPGANPPTNGQPAPQNGSGKQGGPGPRGGGPGGGERGPGPRGDVGGTVSAISGNTVTLKRGDVIVITATVNDSTTYTEAGKSIKLTDLAVGDVVQIRTSTATDGTVTISAVEVVLDHAGGTISAVDASSLTLTRGDNSTVKVTLGSNVTVQDLGKTAAVSDLKTGLKVEVAGKKAADGSIAAQVINIQHDRLGGKVTAISGNTITVEAGGRGPGMGGKTAPGNNGQATPSTGTTSAPVTTTKTITVDGSTIYLAGGQSSALSNIAVGDRVDAVGTLSSDGNSLTALQVQVQLPNYRGQVSSVSGNTIVITERGTSRTIEVTADTKYLNGTATAALTDVKTGQNIGAEGKVDANGKMTASTVQVGQPAGPVGGPGAGGPGKGGPGGHGGPGGGR